MENNLLDKIRKGIVVIGLNNGCPAPNIIEKMCQGWDFVWIDAQHGQHGYESVLCAVRAAGVIGIDTVLRVPGHDYGILGLYADTACTAVMVPMVDDALQAREAVEALRFPPLGKRSYGGRRMIDLYGRDYHETTELMLIAQIETPEAVENVDSIIGTEGIDMVFFGPDDMKLRIGADIDTPAFENGILLKAMEKVGSSAVKAGKAAGCVAGTARDVKIAVGMGYGLFMCGGDMGFIRAGAEKKLGEIRGALSGPGTCDRKDKCGCTY